MTARAALLLCLIFAPATAGQTVPPQTGIADLDIAWGICTRQSGETFVPLCKALRVVRQKYPLKTQAPPPTADYGEGNLDHIEAAVRKWGGVR